MAEQFDFLMDNLTSSASRRDQELVDRDNSTKGFPDSPQPTPRTAPSKDGIVAASLGAADISRKIAEQDEANPVSDTDIQKHKARLQDSINYLSTNKLLNFDDQKGFAKMIHKMRVAMIPGYEAGLEAQDFQMRSRLINDQTNQWIRLTEEERLRNPSIAAGSAYQKEFATVTGRLDAKAFAVEKLLEGFPEGTDPAIINEMRAEAMGVNVDLMSADEAADRVREIAAQTHRQRKEVLELNLYDPEPFILANPQFKPAFQDAIRSRAEANRTKIEGDLAEAKKLGSRSVMQYISLTANRMVEASMREEIVNIGEPDFRGKQATKNTRFYGLTYAEAYRDAALSIRGADPEAYEMAMQEYDMMFRGDLTKNESNAQRSILELQRGLQGGDEDDPEADDGL
jgi:hypothetical protein